MEPEFSKGYYDGKPTQCKWRFFAGAVAASLGIALLTAILVLIIAGPASIPGNARMVGDDQYYVTPRSESVQGIAAHPPSDYAPSTVPPLPKPLPSSSRSKPLAFPPVTYPPTVASTPPPAERRRPLVSSYANRHREGPSPLIMGLLVTELLLVHDVQRLIRKNDSSLASALSLDPEALALSSLFLPRGRVRQLVKAREGGKVAEAESPGKSDALGLGDMRELVVDAVRLGSNLWKAYSSNAVDKGKGYALQCIWTLYCRNLEKMGSLDGPYGLAGRMNGLGLRLAMMDAGADDVFAFVAREMQVIALRGTLGISFTRAGRSTSSDQHNWIFGGGVGLDCAKLFPKCSPMEATAIVMNMALGE